MLVYSARKNSDQRKPLYSVMKPATSSLSASGRSKGARLVSATMAMVNTASAISPTGKNEKANQMCCCICACTIPIMLRVPVPVAMLVIITARDHRHAHGDFVGDHLRARAQAAHQRIVRVGGPARHDHAQHSQRGDAEHEDHSDVHVGDGMGASERDDDEGAEGGHHHADGCEPEDQFVGVGRASGLP